MENVTHPRYFNLTMFLSLGLYRYPAFVLCLLLYAFIVSSNLAMICMVARHKSLHQPMYVLVAYLSANALYGSAAFFPRFLADLLRDEHLITRTACLLQIYVLYTYASYELSILCVMAYDRYVAVCHPLHYQRRMSARVLAALSFLAWVCPACNLAVSVSTVARVPLCGRSVHKVYCANWNLVKLACSAGAVNGAVAIVGAVAIAFFPFGFILYTYLRIVAACWRRSAEVRAKVLQRCSPHLVSFTVFSITSFSDTALSRQRPGAIHPVLAVVLSLEFLIIPPGLNPLVYGLKLPEIRRHFVQVVAGAGRRSRWVSCQAASSVATGSAQALQVVDGWEK